MAYVMINIGSNLGNRRYNLSRAMRKVMMEFGEFEMSHVVESAPWGFESEHPFLNLGMMFRSDLSPREVMQTLQRIERELSPEPHRNPDGSYADRLIDIDIVAIDDMVIDEPDLKVPHPCLAQRRFFLEPMAEIAPGWRHPVTGLTAKEMLDALPAEKEKPEKEN